MLASPDRPGRHFDPGAPGWFRLVTGNNRYSSLVIVDAGAILQDGADKGTDFLVFGVGLVSLLVVL